MQESSIEYGNEQAQLILMKTKESKIFWKLKNDLFKQVLNQHKIEGKPINVEQIQQKAFDTGIEEQLQQLILNCASKSLKNDPIKTDQIEYINQSRFKWSEMLIRNIDYVTDKIKQYRNQANEEESRIELVYIYDTKNLLQFMLQMKNPQASNIVAKKGSLVKHNSIIIPNYTTLKEKYSPLLQSDNQELVQDDTALNKDRMKRARYMIENEALESEVELFAQGGLPSGSRVELYMKYFGIESSHMARYSQLTEEFEKYNTVYDTILIRDSDECAADAKYFVFQEYFEKINKAFLRDKDIAKNLRIWPQNFEHLPQQEQNKVPNCGFFPCKQFTKYLQPFGYCSPKPDIVYSIFKEFYCRYYCYLHSISSVKDSILYLCMLFEDLFQQTDNRLYTHLTSSGYDPLKQAFQWIFHCFIGFVQVEEVFLIMDRIVGFKSLEILSIYALGIFRERQQILFKCKNYQEIDFEMNRPITERFLDTIRRYFLI